MASTSAPKYVSDFYSGMPGQLQQQRTAATIIMIIIAVVLVFVFVSALIMWLVWYRSMGISFVGTLTLMMKSIINIILWPVKFILSLLGLWSDSGPGPLVSSIQSSIQIPLLEPPLPITTTEVIKYEITDCPPCTNECNCPTCEETDIRPYEQEIKYLKNMVKMIGSIARRENAINTQYRELYPGFSVMSPHVRKLSHEYNYIKNEIRKDDDEWQYFKNYFSRLSGIPSSSQSINYDLVL